MPTVGATTESATSIRSRHFVSTENTDRVIWEAKDSDEYEIVIIRHP